MTQKFLYGLYIYKSKADKQSLRLKFLHRYRAEILILGEKLYTKIMKK